MCPSMIGIDFGIAMPPGTEKAYATAEYYNAS